MKKSMFSAPSRNMLRGNLTNKSGNFARSFEKPKHVRSYMTVQNKAYDTRKKVIDSKKDTQQQPKAKLSTEYRFTIPNVPVNQDLIVTMYKQSHNLHNQLIEELHMKSKVVVV